MNPMFTIMLGLLLLSGWGTGFKTRICDHDKTVEAVKKAFDCTLKVWMDSFMKVEIPAGGGIYLDTFIHGHIGLNQRIQNVEPKTLF